MAADSSAVKVCVRVRPLIAREESAASENAEPVQLFWKCDKKSIHQIDDGNSTKSFCFDRVFTAQETTSQLYQNIAKPLVVSTVEGYNGTIFAYGQTSSGKTFTMMGSDHIPGVIPLAVEDVFQTIKNCPKKEFLLRVSYMEIYNETVTDLLVDSWKRKPLEVRETLNKNIYVADLTEELVTSPAQALAWIRKGEKNRHYGKTKMNQRSSRSHTIFRMILESRERSDPVSGENADGAIIVSHLNLVDLAGSERASQTGAEGTRFKEGCNINRSLFTLGQVIKKLTDEGQKGFTNYRDSKLTRILQNSLGGNAKTVIICTITPVTLDETLSTLQFASTAKKMKNDPHVTEVSDDGALLKRYRNEIADLKRRLQEVSSVTHTTATEREVLSQLLQEKDQLQRDQEDRIRNLTKLLVTSNNLDPVKKMPKRRVTWGGKMLRLARSSVCDGDGSFMRKRKADCSYVSELGEEDEFDSQWEIPDEPSDEMEISPCSVTVRSFGDSPKDFVSQDRMHELSSKVSNLELQLEVEGQQKEDAVAKVEKLNSVVSELELQLEVKSREKDEANAKADILDARVLELELQLQTEVQQEPQAVEKILEGAKVAELELQLHTETQQKLEAMEKVEMLGIRVADLERQLEQQSHTISDPDEQMRREFAETIQLCETLASEKDMVVAERDYLKQELGMFIEQTESLEQEKAVLSQELKEKREMDEFEGLEDEFRKEHENELQNEISRLKKALEFSELQCQELQNKVDAVSEQLRSKTEFAEQLQSLSGKDLVQEVTKLRRSLDDAEGVSRDTKKEWAVLRSESIALEEMNVTLTANHKKMEAEVNSLRFQLESEKSRYKTMQSDLQKELNLAFEENTKLTTLLDGKVPKNLIDGVELERKVANLKKELAAAQQVERTLKDQLEELPEMVDTLKKQVCDLTEELGSAHNERDNLLTAQTQWLEEAQQLRDSLQTSQGEILNIQACLNAAAQREEELIQQCADRGQQLDSLRSELELCAAERSRLTATMEETASKLKEGEQHRASLEDKLKETQQLVKDFEEKLDDSESSRTTEEEISKELHEQVNQLSHELQSVRAENDALLCEKDAGLQAFAEMEKLLSTVAAERDQLNVQMAAETQRLKNLHPDDLHEHKESDMLRLSQELQSLREEKDALLRTGAQGSADEIEKLLSAVASLSAERDQLKMDMQENVDMMIENQEELRTALEKNRELKEQIKQLEATQASKQDTSASELSAQLEELRTHLQTLTEELESVRTERDGLLSHSTDGTWSSSEEMDKVLCRVASLSEEKDQLQEILEGLRREKNQLKAELEDRMEMVVQAQRGFNQPEILTSEQQAHHERVTQLQQEVTDAKCLISSLEEELQEQKQRNVDLERLCEQKECDSHQQTKTLTDELESTRAERDALLFEKETNSQSCTEQMEKLQCRVTSLSEERDQLQETLEGLRREKNQLRQELEDRMEMMQCDFQQQLGPLTQSLKEEQEAQQLLQLQQLEEHLERSRAEVNQLKSDLQENVQLMSEELRVSQEKIRALQDELSMLRTTKAELESRLSCESDAGSNLQTQELQMQVQSLREELESIRAERDGVRATTQSCTEQMEKLQCRVTSLSEERDQLQETLEGLRREKNQLRGELDEEMEALQHQLTELNSSLQTVSGEKEQLERALQHNVDMTSTTQELLSSVQEELCRQKQMTSDLLKQSQETECSLGQQIQTLSEKLESSEAQRDHLLSSQSFTEEMERMLCSVASLSKEKEQLHDAVEELTQEKTQIKAELEDMMETLQSQMKTLIDKLGSVESERDNLLSEKRANTQTSTEEMQRMQCRVASLSEERDQLQETVEELRREKMQIKAELENRIEALEAQMETLIEKLKSVEAERDGLLSERTSSSRTVTEEMERVQCRLASLREERDQLQETLEGLTQERNQLRAEVAAIQQKLSEQELLHLQQQTEKGQQEAELRQEVQQMQEQLQMCRHKQAEAHVSQQMLSETSPSKPSLREQLSRVDQCTATVKDSLSSRLQESTGQLEEFFGKFQHFIDMCSKYNHKSLNQALRVQFALKEHELTALPEPTMKAYGAVLQTLRSVQLQLADIIEFLQLRARIYRKQFEQLVKTDLAVFEEKRLQDLLLCRVQAPNYSVKDEDFHSMWEQRLTDLLDKRQLYLKEMGSILEKFSANMISFSTELSAELRERDRLKEQLQGGDSYGTMHNILSCELDHRSALAHSRKTTLQGIMDEHNRVFEELKVLDAQAESQLMEERSKNSTLLKALEGAPLKTESSLLKDNQQLVLQLQQTEEKVKVLRVQNKQLEEAQVKASSRVSNHKQATQLLQTELQDSRAQVEEKENVIQSLKSKLRESEKNASPSGIELEKLSAKLFNLEVELSSASDKHQQEIQRMNTVLNQKEDSLRKLKEALRKAQQQGEESFLQGEDLHARLTNPRGLVVKSSILLEKTKLEDEVKQLKLKITELESLVSGQQAEINKWKNRAIKLKVKRMTEVDAPSSPCTPTKRGLPMSGDCANLLSSPKKFLVTPKKILDSPRKLLDSPKSRFFDVGEPSELLSRNCPKQFFDNSSLGTIPDADAASDKNGQWWPLSPKQEDMCKTQ